MSDVVLLTNANCPAIELEGLAVIERYKGLALVKYDALVDRASPARITRHQGERNRPEKCEFTDTSVSMIQPTIWFRCVLVRRAPTPGSDPGARGSRHLVP